MHFNKLSLLALIILLYPLQINFLFIFVLAGNKMCAPRVERLFFWKLRSILIFLQLSNFNTFHQYGIQFTSNLGPICNVSYPRKSGHLNPQQTLHEHASATFPARWPALPHCPSSPLPRQGVQDQPRVKLAPALVGLHPSQPQTQPTLFCRRSLLMPTKTPRASLLHFSVVMVPFPNRAFFMVFLLLSASPTRLG